MKPVDQTTFGLGTGNCFSACVASLLELDIGEVPFFMGEDDWFAAFQSWLEPRGFFFLGMVLGVQRAFVPPGFYILCGESPRGPHSVVARGGVIVHDPNPTRQGLLTYEEAFLIVPLDPATACARAHKNEPPAMGSPAARTTVDESAVAVTDLDRRPETP